MKGDESMVGDNVKLRRKLTRAIESASALRGERNHAVRQAKRLTKENLYLASLAGRLRRKLTVRNAELVKLKRYKALIFNLVKKVS